MRRPDNINNLPTGPLSFKLYSATTETNLYNASGACGTFGTAGCENSWGVGTITQVISGIAPVWNSGDSGQYLNYMVYGISDISHTGTAPNLNIDSAGATLGGPGADGNIHLDLYVDSAPVPATGPSGRTGYGSYTGVTGGTLWLSMILNSGLR